MTKYMLFYTDRVIFISSAMIQKVMLFRKTYASLSLFITSAYMSLGLHWCNYRPHRWLAAIMRQSDGSFVMLCTTQAVT